MPNAVLDPCEEAAGILPVKSNPLLHYRPRFPLLGQCVYLNSDSIGAAPLSVKRVLDDYWRTLESGQYSAWPRWLNEVRAHTGEIAEFLAAPPDSVISGASIATLFSRVIACFAFRERPRVVVSDSGFPSAHIVLRAFRRYGAELSVAHGGERIAVDPEQVAEALDERTQLVCVSHIASATGALLDVAPIVRRAREIGALVALDAGRSIGAVPVDVNALDVDFAFGASHGWLCGSPENAFLYVRPSLLRDLDLVPSEWNPAELGTATVLPSMLSRPGLAILRDAGIVAIRALSLARTDRIIDRADQAGLAVATPRLHQRRGGIVALRFPGDDDVARQLAASNFVCGYHGGIRIAPHFYNTDDEVERFMDELVRLARER